jgi:hypothetical protein
LPRAERGGKRIANQSREFHERPPRFLPFLQWPDLPAPEKRSVVAGPPARANARSGGKCLRSSDKHYRQIKRYIAV